MASISLTSEDHRSLQLVFHCGPDSRLARWPVFQGLEGSSGQVQLVGWVGAQFCNSCAMFCPLVGRLAKISGNFRDPRQVGLAGVVGLGAIPTDRPSVVRPES